MEHLIWYSIPGAVFVAAVLLCFPSLATNNQGLLIVTAPAAGFIIHQIVRILHEWRGGWAYKNRPIVTAIQQLFPDRTDPLTAWLTWEVTLYSDDAPTSLRDRDRRAWQYVLSFWSVVLAAIASELLVLVVLCSGVRVLHPLLSSVVFLFLIAVFVLKADMTILEISKLEEAFLRSNLDLFRSTAERLQSAVRVSMNLQTAVEIEKARLVVLLQAVKKTVLFTHWVKGRFRRNRGTRQT